MCSASIRKTGWHAAKLIQVSGTHQIKHVKGHVLISQCQIRKHVNFSVDQELNYAKKKKRNPRIAALECIEPYMFIYEQNDHGNHQQKCEGDETFWVLMGHDSPVTELVQSATVTKKWWIHAKVAAEQQKWP